MSTESDLQSAVSNENLPSNGSTPPTTHAIHRKQVISDLITKQRDSIQLYFELIDQTAIERLVELLLQCQRLGNKLFISGVGKSYVAAKKAVSTFASIGIEAHTLSALDALHGDLGVVTAGDIVLLISKSGETDELVQLVPFLKAKGAIPCSLVSKATSRLAGLSQHIFLIPQLPELCPYDLAPTNSVLAQLLFLDAVAIAIMHLHSVEKEMFALNHPGGRIGKRLTLKVSDVMLPKEHLPVSYPEELLQSLLVTISAKACGCLLIIDHQERLLGIFTDGDLRRSLQSFGTNALSLPIGELMTYNPRIVHPWESALHAIGLIEHPSRPTTVLPVVSGEGILVGLVRLHDLVQLGIS
jgi:arabinose-5-phosphate isomerase